MLDKFLRDVFDTKVWKMLEMKWYQQIQDQSHKKVEQKKLYVLQKH